MVLDIELRFRVHILMNEIEKSDLPVIDMTPCIRSLQVHFDVNKISAREVCEKVKEINANLSSLDDITVPSRIIKLPLSWDDPQTQLAAKRYQQTVRPNAPWCPSNPEFIRRIKEVLNRFIILIFLYLVWVTFILAHRLRHRLTRVTEW